MKIEYIVIAIIVIICLIIIAKINKLIGLKKNIERSNATIDVFLKKRYDLIPNLVEVVKEHSKYENSTMEDITKLRAKFNESNDSEAGNKLHDYYKQILMVVEKYPDLKASEQYLNLQKELSKVESEIQASRRLYINSITEYNNMVKSIPTNVIALVMGYKEIEYPKYEIHDFEINFK